MQIWFIISLLAIAHANPVQDLVNATDLLNIVNITITETLYSGYLPVNSAQTAQFHYFFVLKNDSLPVTLWLNGGPGCSSAQGLFNENGPFNFIRATAVLQNNKYSWSNVTNMLYIESPIGVGYSYGPAENQTDASTAAYNLQALISFYTKFPQFAKTPFYISGESYAGIYIPTLASNILDYNLLATTLIKIPLTGLMIGNGCTDPSECTDVSGFWQPHIFDFYGGHNLISKETYKLVLDHAAVCYGSVSEACYNITLQVEEDFSANSNLNPYNVYGDCPIYKNTSGKSSSKLSAIQYLKNPQLRDHDVPPCADVQGLFTWLVDSQAFKTALHVNQTLSSAWEICSGGDFSYTKDDRASYYLYPKLIKSGLRIWKFSGDADGVVPITGTLNWINKLQNQYNLRTLVQWRPWYMAGDYDVQRQVGGNYWKLDGITFVSVRGAGHMVPSDKRHAALDLFTAFINNQDLPTQ